MNFLFFLECLFLGIGLAMDAFSVSLANGMTNKNMRLSKQIISSSIFGIFQGLMPFIGWFCIHTFLSYFESFSKFIPWIALALLAFLGTKMIIDSFKPSEDSNETKLGFFAIIVQGIATSIDALSVGFTFAEYNIIMVIMAILIIAITTFIICFFGVTIGKRFGTKLSNKANLFGGIILIFIGLEIFLTGII